uniref:Uncharacterized protein n=1 Tax=Ditylenchus dipsaci TaxID=166011 RepID=A0A915D519_9BILA
MKLLKPFLPISAHCFCSRPAKARTRLLPLHHLAKMFIFFPWLFWSYQLFAGLITVIIRAWIKTANN